LKKAVDRMDKINMHDPETLYQQAFSLHQSGNIVEAIEIYRHLMKQYPKNPHVLKLLGTAEAQRGNFLESIELLGELLKINPDNPEVYNNRGIALHELKRFEEALQSFDRALQLKPDLPEVHYNRGKALLETKRFDEAVRSFDRAIQLQPDYPEAHNNRGVALLELKCFDEAVRSFDRAIQLKPVYSEVHINRGVAFQKLKCLDEALQSYYRAIQLNPDNDFWSGKWFNVKLSCCDWENFDKHKNDISNGIINNKKMTSPFLTLYLVDSLDIQKQSARIWVNDTCISSNSSINPEKYPLHDKIRIGYFSADFHNHATLHLMAEMFEKHDRSRYELYGFSFGPESNDPWRQRAQKCFDRFFDVRLKSDQDVAKSARDLQIDIAVDLKGFTEDLRPNIFALRAAPVQANYLGYPGTMGAEFMDYIIADSTIIPESDRRHYTEKVVYLPCCYQVNCRNRDVSQKMLTRGELHLPQDGFVFCCFNNNIKITPTMFDSWMRILQQVDDSVLWLFKSNRWAVDNLRMEAEKRGVTAQRLVFAENLPVEEHLNRIRHADLFLDTLPYNAHTTASDALRMGVLLVTLTGNAFAGRVAASLLNTLDLGELIAHSAEEYEKIAIDLAVNRDRLQGIKDKLNANVQTSSLFDSERFTRHIEKAYELMYERYRNGLVPDHIVV
jgi:predicted O-linked N-acetylglucosamine transferase (SPINDLY family)